MAAPGTKLKPVITPPVVTVTSGGGGYVSAPTVSFTAAPTGGTTAQGTAVLTGGVVTGITITNPGAGYTTTPTVLVAAPIPLVPPVTSTRL